MSGSKMELDDRRRTTSKGPAPARDDRRPAQENLDNRVDGNNSERQRKQLETPDTSTARSGRTTSELVQPSDRKHQESSNPDGDEEKFSLYQKKVSKKMALGRVRQAERQQDEGKLKLELDDIKQKFPELAKSETIKNAEELLTILRTSKELRDLCDRRDAHGIEEAIKKIEGSQDKRLQEMLRLQVREANYILEGLTKTSPKKGYRWQVDVHSFNELRRYANPPPDVLPVMQAVFLLLGTDEGRTETWPDIQRLCKPNGKEGLYNRVLNLDVERVLPGLAARAREIVKETRPNNNEGHQTKNKNVPGEETPQRDTTTELNGDYNTPRNDDQDPVTSREVKKDKEPTKQGGGIDYEKLKTSCPVAWTLLVWVLDVADKVESLHGRDEMTPADLKKQRELLGLRLPRIPRMDRQYYHILAKNSMTRTYPHGSGIYGGQSYRDLFPANDKHQQQQQQQHSPHYQTRKPVSDTTSSRARYVADDTDYRRDRQEHHDSHQQAYNSRATRRYYDEESY